MSYAEISRKLKEAGYQHAFQNDDGREIIDMAGIAVTVSTGNAAVCFKNQHDQVEAMKTISKKVQEKFSVTQAEIKSRLKTENITYPRQVIMYLARKKGVPCQTIGDFLNRDHTSVLHGEKKIQDRMDTEPKTKIMVTEIQMSLQ